MENRNNSVYRTTPIKDFYLSYWDDSIKPMPRETDILLKIPPEFHLRPDLLAFDLYGNPNLFWIFAALNMDTIIDPINDFTAGKVIYVPVQGTLDVK